MVVERLFAKIHRGVDIGDAFLERVRVNGYLTEVLSEYLRAGGDDPRQQQATGTAAMGAPLQRNEARERRASRRVPAWVLYVNTMENQGTRANGPPRSKAQRIIDRAKLKADLDDLPDEERTLWETRADEEFVTKRIDAAQEGRLPAVEPMEMVIDKTRLCGLIGDGVP
eukprot:4123454-Pyramimonas_sp.AAC.1